MVNTDSTPSEAVFLQNAETAGAAQCYGDEAPAVSCVVPCPPEAGHNGL